MVDVRLAAGGTDEIDGNHFKFDSPSGVLQVFQGPEVVALYAPGQWVSARVVPEKTG